MYSVHDLWGAPLTISRRSHQLVEHSSHLICCRHFANSFCFSCCCLFLSPFLLSKRSPLCGWSSLLRDGNGQTMRENFDYQVHVRGFHWFKLIQMSMIWIFAFIWLQLQVVCEFLLAFLESQFDVWLDYFSRLLNFVNAKCSRLPLVSIYRSN